MNVLTKAPPYNTWIIKIRLCKRRKTSKKCKFNQSRNIFSAAIQAKYCNDKHLVWGIILGLQPSTNKNDCTQLDLAAKRLASPLCRVGKKNSVKSKAKEIQHNLSVIAIHTTAAGKKMIRLI